MFLLGTQRVNEAGHLEIGGCDTLELAAQYNTPLYVMDEAHIRKTMRNMRAAFAATGLDTQIIYASKAFTCVAMARIAAQEGLSIDVASAGELYTALRADFPVERIVFHGNNKSPEELRMALEFGIGQIVVDNLYELELLNKLATSMGKRARILLRLTPGVEAHTHTYTQTGQQDSKFGLGISDGIAAAAIRQTMNLPGIELIGVHAHIGSQIFDTHPYQLAVGIVFDFLKQLRNSIGFVAQVVDMGGGLGVVYHEGDEPPAIGEYVSLIAKAVREEAERDDYPLPRLVLEPGRSLVGEAGTTLYTIGSIKEIPGIRSYVAVDGGMADNPRVALYQAEYEGLIAGKAGRKPECLVTVTGKCCESGDMLIWDIQLADPKPGDILAVFTTGAYNYSMASNYTRLPRPAMVSVYRGKAELFVARETYIDLIALDRIPERLQKKEVPV